MGIMICSQVVLMQNIQLSMYHWIGNNWLYKFDSLAPKHRKYSAQDTPYIDELSYYDTNPNSKPAHTSQYQTHQNTDIDNLYNIF